MKLVEDNKSLEDQVLALTIEAKGLETRAANAEALVKSREGEVAKLRFSLAVVEKERQETTTEKEKIQQKSFDDVYNAHEVGFNHFLWQVFHLCVVSDTGVFDINKDVYDGKLVLIDDISKDAVSTLERLMTLAEDFHAKDVDAEDEDHTRPRE